MKKILDFKSTLFHRLIKTFVLLDRTKTIAGKSEKVHLRWRENEKVIMLFF